MVRPVEGLTIINAGTLRRDQYPGFLVVDFAGRRVQACNLDPETGAVTEGREFEL